MRLVFENRATWHLSSKSDWSVKFLLWWPTFPYQLYCKKNLRTLYIICIISVSVDFLSHMQHSVQKHNQKPVIKSKNKPALSAYSYSMFSQQHHIKHTHILPGSHMSKQTFKSLQKYKFLPICISFFIYILRWQRSYQIGMKAQWAIWVQRYTSESLSNQPPSHLCQWMLHVIKT